MTEELENVLMTEVSNSFTRMNDKINAIVTEKNDDGTLAVQRREK